MFLLIWISICYKVLLKENIIYLHCIALLFCQWSGITDPILGSVGLFSGLLLSQASSYIANLDVGHCQSFRFVILLQKQSLRIIPSQQNQRTSLLISTKWFTHFLLLGITLNLKIRSGRTGVYQAFLPDYLWTANL